MRFLLTVLLVVVPLAAAEPVASKPVLDNKGLEAFYNLDFPTAISEFREETKQFPNNPDGFNRLAYSILYREMFRNGALETQLVSGSNPFLRRPKMEVAAKDEAEFFGALNRVTQLCDAALAKDPKDTRALYAKGVGAGFRANYNFLVKKAWRDALRDATEARKLHNRVVELDPKFTDARLMQGVHDYVIGSLPFTWKMLGFLVGFRGDKDAGIRELELVSHDGHLNKTDAQVLLAAVYRRERRPGDAVPVLKNLISHYPRNYLMRLELAQMYSDLGKRDDALAAYKAVKDLKASNAPGYEGLAMEKVYFYEGNLLFWYNEPDAAIDSLKKATAKTADLDLNTSIYAWLRLGQSYDLKGNREEAKKAYQRVLSLAPDSDAAKEAREFNDKPYRHKNG